ncbi:MAG: hypothetical protein V4819_22370 [Verrucomicrobiota bacterium]
MKISRLKVILTLSILANVVLAIQIGLLTFSTRFNEHYYRDFTGMLIQSTHAEISKGNTVPTLEILKAIPWHPEYKDLSNALSKFSAMNQSPTQAEYGATSDHH